MKNDKITDQTKGNILYGEIISPKSDLNVSNVSNVSKTSKLSINLLKDTIGNEKCRVLVKNNDYADLFESSEVYTTNCEYCNKKIYAIWDENNKNNWWPYPGNSAKSSNAFKYSDIIQYMKKNDNAIGRTWLECPLMNINARCHSNPTNPSKRFSTASVRFLCNSCFRLTFNRIQVKGDDGILYSLSVVESLDETVESVMKDLDITGQILGKGGISDYE